MTYREFHIKNIAEQNAVLTQYRVFVLGASKTGRGCVVFSSGLKQFFNRRRFKIDLPCDIFIGGYFGKNVVKLHHGLIIETTNLPNADQAPQENQNER
nr:hypothetical protein [uncultured Desulfobacter sp.]